MISIFTSNWFIFFPLGFSRFVALRLAEGSSDSGQRSTSVAIVGMTITLLFAFSLLAVGLRGNPLGLLWLVVLGGMASMLFSKQRRLERAAVLLTALQAQHEQQQFAVADTLWLENRGWLRRQANQLRRDLSQGLSWWSSLEKHRIARSVYEKLAVRLAATYGVGSATPVGTGVGSQSALVSQTRPPESQHALLTPLQVEAEVERHLGRMAVFSWVVLDVLLVAMIYVFIIPTLNQMMSEFGMTPPPVWDYVLGAASYGTTPKFLMLFNLILLGLAGAIATTIIVWMFPHLMQRAPLRLLAGDYYRNAGVMALHQVMHHQPDLASACRTTYRLIDLEAVAVPYEHTARLIEAGSQPHQALRQAGLLTAHEAQSLQAALDRGDVAWALQTLTQWKQQRMLRRLSVLIQWLVVLLTLILAVAVGSIAVSVFQVLTEMTYAL